MAELTDAEIDAALERGRLAEQSELRAETERYDRRNSRIVVDLLETSIARPLSFRFASRS